MKLEPVIGLEIHVQLKTKSKMFCRCANIFPAAAGPRGAMVADVEPNSAICPICLGYPGTLPLPNRQAVEWTQLAGAALGCELATDSKFDRKSYFYPDLPKGYQISQYDKPLCLKGSLTLATKDGEATVGITRIHLEEDAAKNTHPSGADFTLVDFNRAGTPLMEIVTEPEMRSPQQAKAFLQELQRIVRALGISDADMEKGQMRCDANISLREAGSQKLNPKTEIKNINSFRFVEKALTHEIQRQSASWNKGEVPSHATRGWDSERGITVEQRTKEEAADYRYFPEPDIPPFVFSQDYLNNIRKQVPELPHQKRGRMMSEYGLAPNHANLLIANADLAHLFEDTASEIEQINREEVGVADSAVPALISQAGNIILRDVRQLMEKENLAHEDLKISANNLAEVIILLQAGKMNRNALQPVLAEMQKTGGEPEVILQKLGLEQESGEDALEQYVQQAIDENPEAIEKIKAGKEAATQFLMGQVMAKSGGKANPQVVIELLRKKILGH